MEDLRPRLEKALADQYVIERELGGGGMSRTYLAREKAFDRRVVIKVLAPELLAGISVERFRREILLAAQLQHPHVVPVLTAGDVDGLPWFTMPYVDGDSLRQRLGQGRVGISETVGILRDVARALAYAHQHGVAHRDIKPDNVLLSAGSATVTDFGIAKAITAARGEVSFGTALTVAGTSIGTPTYMAPEQAAGDPDTDHRADLYSFGAMAYELLSGQAPFHGLAPSKMLAAKLSETPKDIRTLCPDCPEALADLVTRCLMKEPDDRPQQAIDVARVLDNITSSGAGAAAPAILAGRRIRFGRAIALWAGATALVALTAWAATDVIGLPDWVFPGSLGVMLAGLPVILTTWYVQRAVYRAYTTTPQLTPGGNTATHGTMHTLAIKASPHFSWKRAWLGGGIAVGSFAALVISFMVMRAMGIGPFGSLQGRGEFGAEETIIVADFRSPATDSSLGATAAEALRTDLAQSKSLKVFSRASMRQVLTLMQRTDESTVPFELAREIATREGAKALLDGSIVRLGQSYVISARLVAALDGTELVTFRETAASEDELIGALGRLSRSVRERAGESLKNIRRTSELERVTTPSLAALRKYVEGSLAADEKGEIERGIALLQEAATIDTGFAMAWRKIAVLLNNERREQSRALAAIETAYRHRARLSEAERLLTEGYYFTRGSKPDRDKALAAYEAAARLDSTNTSALNNAAVVRTERREFERAEEIYRRVISLPRTFGGAFTNLLAMQIINGRSPAALDSTRGAYHARFPESADLWEADWFVAYGSGDLAQADSIGRAANARARTARQAIRGANLTSTIAELRGRPREAMRWATISREATLRAEPAPAVKLGFALDSAYYLAGTMERPAEARAVIARGLARVPMSQIPPAERDWLVIGLVAASIRDPALARQARDGFERDQAAQTPDPEGARASYASMVAQAEGRWSDARALLAEADRRYALPMQVATNRIAQMYDLAGDADSAIVHFERYLERRDGAGWIDAQYRAGTHKRLGELYDAKGNTEKAVEHYSKFVEMWKDAEPELHPKVTIVRNRLARLRPPG